MREREREREREEVPYLTELGSEGVVDLVEGTSKSGELLASLVGDEKLSHRIPTMLFDASNAASVTFPAPLISLSPETITLRLCNICNM